MPHRPYLKPILAAPLLSVSLPLLAAASPSFLTHQEQSYTVEMHSPGRATLYPQALLARLVLIPGEAPQCEEFEAIVKKWQPELQECSSAIDASLPTCQFLKDEIIDFHRFGLSFDDNPAGTQRGVDQTFSLETMRPTQFDVAALRTFAATELKLKPENILIVANPQTVGTPSVVMIESPKPSLVDTLRTAHIGAPENQVVTKNGRFVVHGRDAVCDLLAGRSHIAWSTKLARELPATSQARTLKADTAWKIREAASANAKPMKGASIKERAALLGYRLSQALSAAKVNSASLSDADALDLVRAIYNLDSSSLKPYASRKAFTDEWTKSQPEETPEPDAVIRGKVDFEQ